VVRQQPDRTVTVPELERGGLLLRLPVRLLDLENRLLAVLGSCRLHEDGRSSGLELLAEGEPPALCDYAGVGQRYASACRFLSDGSFSRIRCSRARSSSAEITVSSSGACARTIPHGSTISERP